MKELLNKTVLLVDDDIDCLTQLNLHLEALGFNVVSVGSQKEAEKLLENLKPDLVITDLMMENKDSGFILSYKIKKKYPEVPVIIATAVTAETGLLFGLESEDDKKWIKADLYIEKGIRQDQLQREIHKLLKF